MLRGTTEELIEWCYYVYINHKNATCSLCVVFICCWRKAFIPQLTFPSFVFENRYDLNGDGGLAREELHHCLKGCIYTGYGIEADELDEAERDIVEIGK